MAFRFHSKLLDQIRQGRRMVVAKYGAGKTKLALQACLDYLANQSTDRGRGAGVGNVIGGKFLLVSCPKKNIRTWQTEINKWAPSIPVWIDRDVEYLTKNPPATGRYEILLVNHHKLFTLSALLVTLPIGAFVMDESTVIKHHDTRVAKSAEVIARSSPMSMRLALTGDPTPENEREIWSQLNFVYLDANPLGSTYYQFLRRWFLKTDNGYVLHLHLRDKFFEVVDRALVRMDTDDWSELNQIIGVTEEKYVTFKCEPSIEQQELLHRLLTDWQLTDHSGRQHEYWHSIAIAQKAQQIASGFFYTGEDWYSTDEPPTERITYLQGVVPKLQMLAEVIDQLITEGHRRIVVWHAYKAEAQMIHAAVSSILEPLTFDARQLTRFAKEPKSDKDVLAMIVPISAARGLNDFVTAGVEIFVSNRYSQELRNQAESRLVRPGQTHKTVLHIDLCTTDAHDLKVVEALQAKQLTDARMATIVKEFMPKVTLSESA